MHKNKNNIEIIEIVRLGAAKSVENIGFSSLIYSIIRVLTRSE